MRVEYRLHGDDFVVVVSHRIHAGDGATVDDHLGPGVAVGLKQHWVHVGVRRKSRGLGLDCLSAADLTAVSGDRAVESHVLRLERHHCHTLSQQPAAQRSHQGALACIGGGALHHQGTHDGSLR
ncbi:hypothetical protein D3C79_708200 [compost metagenome]